MKQTSERPQRVDDLMTDDLVTVSVDDPLGRARDLILTLGIGALPVTDREAVVGIVTASDLADDWDESIPISEIMSHPVVRVSPQATLQEAAEQMLTFRVHHLIVEGDGRIGIITTFDLLRLLA